ncbi:MAG: nicotinamide-nucleotide amidase [Alphaproteobacteria bacterium]
MINFTINQKKELATTLGELLMVSHASVATVESCTGGGLASAITEIAGSSQWFNQSWVTYSNDAKHSLIGVNTDTIDTFGAVSEQVVMQMAEKGAVLANADLCISISGVAGPGGGSEDKPVGFVWFAIAGHAIDKTYTFNRRFTGDRSQVREQAVVLALQKLIQCLAD